MALIFLGSSSLLAPRMSFEGTEVILGPLNLFIRKVAHFIEFAILTFFWFRSIWISGKAFRMCLIWCVLLSVMYAGADELHQHYVPQRLGAWTDVILDSLGAAFSGGLLWRIGMMGRRESQIRFLGGIVT